MPFKDIIFLPFIDSIQINLHGYSSLLRCLLVKEILCEIRMVCINLNGFSGAYTVTCTFLPVVDTELPLKNDVLVMDVLAGLKLLYLKTTQSVVRYSLRNQVRLKGGHQR